MRISDGSSDVCSSDLCHRGGRRAEGRRATSKEGVGFMRILFCGDVVGRPGRDAVAAHLPGLRQRLSLDFVIVNGENAASGFGITDKICRQLFEAGADVITGGNHSWDQREVMSYIAGEPRLDR